ncbi:glycosylasparaginase [Gilvibacter sp. SZ-19]|uniref:isoaspartyl peptidase/L-asparaginase family protein n=1 Tax=Gilvibacter sp. SZ-19 TaxID=754429 RepID=UPI000B3BF501|nr:N(4)-(beta-N-acetylglucosaminyl)-L-asparaginase [Gilvibacter sp. SZ-19]ARV11575.1 glycosylasparaginase [Gilvibacter sp. SZ-19]
MKRRTFLKNTSLGSLALGIPAAAMSCAERSEENKVADAGPGGPVVLATWNVNNATKAAWDSLAAGSSALDAVEAGCKIEEADIKNSSVGKGGLPDRDGNVTLDACIMDHTGNCGSVVYLQNITHAITVARSVMEDTPHVMLAGKGAEMHALSIGLEAEDLLTPESKAAWEKWKETSQYKPIINIENHDTIGMLVMDKDGTLAGGCTTSGLAYKMQGRVGDSPIIGSGLFVDNEVGAAVATGLGEEVVKTVGSFLIVELMRQGKSPQEACEEAIRRIVEKPGSNYKDFQVGYIAMNKKGETGYYAIHKGFWATQYQGDENKNFESDFYNK